MAYYFNLKVFDISNPTNPIVVGHLDGSWANITISGHYIYLDVGFGPFWGVDIYDASNPTLPVSVNQMNYESYHTLISDHYAYIVSGLLYILDVSDVRNPIQVSSPWPMARDAAISDGYAYAACYTNGLTIYNVHDPANPALNISL